MSRGFADTHCHQFANLGFGGLAFWGSAYGDIQQALEWCRPAHGLGGVGDIMGNLLRTFGYGAPGLGVGHLEGGNPQFDGWPRWDSLTHQSVYVDWLRRAVDGGLRLMVMLAVNSEGIARKATDLPGHPDDDMGAADLQLQAAYDLQAHLDERAGGAGAGWYRIVETPHQAREVIDQGKLAVVLGIEVDNLFDCRAPDSMDGAEVLRRLDRYYEFGVRHLFPIHFADNGFGGTAFQNDLIRSKDEAADRAVNPLTTLAAGQYEINTEPTDMFTYRTGRRNVRGLTDLGRTLVRGMISRGMMIDVDHMSWKSRDEVLTICEERDYPVMSGHTGFTEISIGPKVHEGQLTAEEFSRIMALGGMVSIIVGQGNRDDIITWPGPQTTITHNCGRSSQTLSQAYLYAITKSGGRPVGFGTDFNGFAGLPGPRFGTQSCPGEGSNDLPRLRYAFRARASGVEMDKSVVGEKVFDFNDDGLAHIGMLPDLIADFEAMGMTPQELEPICNSAEGYVRAWERAWSRSEHSTTGLPSVFTLLAGQQDASAAARGLSVLSENVPAVSPILASSWSPALLCSLNGASLAPAQVNPIM